MRTIHMLAMPGVQLLDVSGPMDVFAEANVQSGLEEYTLRVIGLDAAPIRSSSGVRLVPDHAIGDELPKVDTVLVAGCPHAPQIELANELKQWLRRSCQGAKRYGSVCSGAFMLAASGQLDGRSITTHWAVADELAAAYPAIHVDADALHMRDGPVRTAAGVTAGLDLALVLVEEDLGREIALKVAAQLVMFFKRPGGQMQFSRHGEAEPGGRSALQQVQRWVIANPGDDHSVANLAERTGLSPRHFARIFQQELGVTPGAWVEAARVTAARQMLENAHHLPKQVAAACGFADVDTLRRAFMRQIGVTPAAYRRRFL
ncbi:GlxA family transcriptional regulator [Phyllobacterium sp. YR531]|uniref:GlxA family transcriptional regulator n=1 Tax=Phyllobacterium sp. YR531 TaxID=1144343 RepID=UPI00026FCC40|nr:GlxA family transcriptional regulator [Phyllobacterium sp. YR531]EJN03064.1 transcriptional regulator containing an amidase domain and an AraC-type DNA-binding HTH domain [Phyllobacterium sp. YR531]